MCPSRGDEIITKSIMVLTSPLGACMLSARQTKQTDATIRQTDHVASVLAISEGCCLVLCGSFELVASRFLTSCLSWASGHGMTAFVSFLWMVIFFAGSRFFMAMSSCLSWASGHDMAVFASFSWVVISFIGPRSFLVIPSEFTGFFASLLGAFLHCSVLWFLVWL